MSLTGRRILWAAIAGGTVLRLVLGFTSEGIPYDTASIRAVRDALSSHPLDVYSIVNGHPNNRWPYPPGFFPWVAFAGGGASVTGLSLHGWFVLPQIAAEGAMAWLVQDYLGRRGARETVRLAAAALIALGPAFWIVSAWHGHIDSVAILPVVLAVWLWDRWPAGTRRALACGVLIGLGTVIKLVPLMMLVAFLPWMRSRREAALLVVPAVAIPLLAFAPFLIADYHGTVDTFQRHRTLPGFGGISLLLQPDLAGYYLHHHPTKVSGLSEFVLDREGPIIALLMAPFILLVLLRPPHPAAAAAVLWLALVAVNPGFEFQFAVWALPFALMVGWVWQVAAVEAALLIPAVLLYWHPFGYAPTAVYQAIMIALTCAILAVVVRLGVRLARSSYM